MSLTSYSTSMDLSQLDRPEADDGDDWPLSLQLGPDQVSAPRKSR